MAETVGNSNDSSEWIAEEDILHTHKLGSVLQFILLSEGFDQWALCDQVTDTYICATNYSELTGE